MIDLSLAPLMIPGLIPWAALVALAGGLMVLGYSHPKRFEKIIYVPWFYFSNGLMILVAGFAIGAWYGTEIIIPFVDPQLSEAASTTALHRLNMLAMVFGAILALKLVMLVAAGLGVAGFTHSNRGDNDLSDKLAEVDVTKNKEKDP